MTGNDGAHPIHAGTILLRSTWNHVLDFYPQRAVDALQTPLAERAERSGTEVVPLFPDETGVTLSGLTVQDARDLLDDQELWALEEDPYQSLAAWCRALLGASHSAQAAMLRRARTVPTVSDPFEPRIAAHFKPGAVAWGELLDGSTVRSLAVVVVTTADEDDVLELPLAQMPAGLLTEAEKKRVLEILADHGRLDHIARQQKAADRMKAQWMRHVERRDRMIREAKEAGQSGYSMSKAAGITETTVGRILNTEGGKR